MSERVDYYLSLSSPWSYLGHDRLAALAGRYRRPICIYPVDVGAVFSETGGLPLPKRSPARQAYRLLELERWREVLAIPLNLHPRHFPTNDGLAAGMVLALRAADGEAAVRLAGRVLRAVWAEDRDIADRATLHALASELELDADALLERGESPEVRSQREAETRVAIERGVFGAPSYLYRDELFWGQDRLDLLERALGRG